MIRNVRNFWFLGFSSSLLKSKKFFKLGGRNFHLLKNKKFCQREFFAFLELGKLLPEIWKVSWNIRKFHFLKYKEFFLGFPFPKYQKMFLNIRTRKFHSPKLGANFICSSSLNLKSVPGSHIIHYLSIGHHQYRQEACKSHWC